MIRAVNWTDSPTAGEAGTPLIETDAIGDAVGCGVGATGAGCVSAPQAVSENRMMPIPTTVHPAVARRCRPIRSSMLSDRWRRHSNLVAMVYIRLKGRRRGAAQ